MSKLALITGATGQDGYYLAKLLKSHGYKVDGLVRRSSGRHKERELVFAYLDKTIHGDVTDYETLCRTFLENKYDECYHLAAQSHVAESFHDPYSTMRINVTGTLNVLEAIRHFSSSTRLYFAASSEMFGNEPAPQSTNTPFMPRSPYGVSKLAAYQLVKNYRESFSLFVCSGILFNHESPIRGDMFVTRKIVKGAVAIKKGLQKEIVLGNLEAQRDWGHAADYVNAMHMMLQRDAAQDFVIGTGKTYSVAQFCVLVFRYLGLDYYDKPYIRTDSAFCRPAEVNQLRADITQAVYELKWQPTYDIEALIKDMVDYELLNGQN